MKKFRTCCLILGFIIVLSSPLLLQKGTSHFALSGVTEAAPFPALTMSGLLDGTLQETLNTYYSENLPGRDLMIKIRNQAIFSLYSKSPNNNIIIGKDKVLFEKEYILKYEKYYPPVTSEFTEDLCAKLTAIQEKLEARGKEMYLFITPTKVRYYEAYVPEIYVQANRFPDSPGNYEQFTETLKQYPLHVYDSIPYIDELAPTADYPLFHRTGTHWSQVLSAEVAADFVRYLNEESMYSFPEITITYHSVAEPIYPDADIFDSLNLLSPPYDKNYLQADWQFHPRKEERPNLLCRGGSFMGQTLVPLINHGFFGQDTYIENTLVTHYPFSQFTPFSDYSEIDLKKEIDQADIIIFEVNEAHIPVMSFSLIDYLMEHPELLDQ